MAPDQPAPQPPKRVGQPAQAVPSSLGKVVKESGKPIETRGSTSKK